MKVPRHLADPSRWSVEILPLPPRQSRARATAICGGFAVGSAAGRGGRDAPRWWPEGRPEPLECGDRKNLAVRGGSGRVVAGFFERPSGGGGAVGWRLEDGRLVGRDLHPAEGWEKTLALGAGGDAYAGFGRRKAPRGARVPDQALAWRGDGTMVALPAAEEGGEAMAHATDGLEVVGNAGRTGGQRAALWPLDGSRLELLGDTASLSEAYGVRDGEQVGVRWSRRGSAPALWRGTAASFVDLTPRGFAGGAAWGCAAGVQVGLVQEQAVTRGGAASLFTRAALWCGDAASFVDLQALLPGEWNASSAQAIDLVDGVLCVAGCVEQVAIENEMTPRESHWLAAQQGVLWKTPLD